MFGIVNKAVRNFTGTYYATKVCRIKCTLLQITLNIPVCLKCLIKLTSDYRSDRWVNHVLNEPIWIRDIWINWSRGIYLGYVCMSLNVNINVRSTNICLLFGVFYWVVNIQYMVRWSSRHVVVFLSRRLWEVWMAIVLPLVVYHCVLWREFFFKVWWHSKISLFLRV